MKISDMEAVATKITTTARVLWFWNGRMWVWSTDPAHITKPHARWQDDDPREVPA